MENGNMGYGHGYDNNQWLWALLFGGGNGFGFGNRGREGDVCCPPVTLEQLNDSQNALASQIRDSEHSANEHFLTAADASARNQLSNATSQMGIQASIATANSQNLIGQKDLTAAVASGNCDLRVGQQAIINEQQKCCCELGNKISEQTNTLERAICSSTSTITGLITDNRTLDLQNQLNICRDENSNLRQTTILSKEIRDECGRHRYGVEATAE